MVAPRPASRLASASNSLPASSDRVRPLATGVDVEVQPVLDRLGIGDDMEPDARPVALRVADPVCPVGQLLLGHPQLAVEVVPGSESSRGRRELIAQRGGPEPGQPVRVGTVDDQLKADRHRFPLQGRPGSYPVPRRTARVATQSRAGAFVLLVLIVGAAGVRVGDAGDGGEAPVPSCSPGSSRPHGALVPPETDQRGPAQYAPGPGFRPPLDLKRLRFVLLLA